MLKNLIVTICLDLEKPEKLEESLKKWIKFTKNSIYEFLDQIDPLRR